MKKTRWYLLAAVLVIVAVAAVILISRFRQAPASSDVQADQAEETLGETQPQTFLASDTPALEADDLVFGDRDADLPIFVYEDYSSQYSADLADTLEKIRAESDGQVAIIVRPFLSTNSAASARLAVAVGCAGEQGKWKEMRALLFAQAKSKQLLEDKMADYATQLRLNEEEFQTCLTNPQKSETIGQAVASARQYGVQGAPTIFIAGEMVIGARPYDDFVDSNGDQIAGLKSLINEKLQ